MNQFISILSLIASLTAVFLQFQNSKLKKLEDENVKLKSNLLKSLKSIQGYQDFIIEISNEKSVNLESFKGEIHSKYKESFISTHFLQPGNIQELINKYDS